MRRCVFISLLLFSSICAMPQERSERAPTLAQCHADIDAWLTDRWNIDRLSARQIQIRSIELAQCGQAYPQLLRWKEYPSATSGGKTSDLEAIQSLYERETDRRYDSFLNRHGLLLQFYDEDEGGKR